MAEDEEEGRFSSLSKFFSRIGKGVTRIGETTKEAPKQVKEDS